MCFSVHPNGILLYQERVTNSAFKTGYQESHMTLIAMHALLRQLAYGAYSCEGTAQWDCRPTINYKEKM